MNIVGYSQDSVVSGDPRVAVHVASGGGALGGGGASEGGGASSWVLTIRQVTRLDAGRWGINGKIVVVVR